MVRDVAADARFEFGLLPLDTTPVQTKLPRRGAHIATDAPRWRQVVPMLPGQRNADEQAENRAAVVPAARAHGAAML